MPVTVGETEMSVATSVRMYKHKQACIRVNITCVYTRVNVTRIYTMSVCTYPTVVLSTFVSPCVGINVRTPSFAMFFLVLCPPPPAARPPPPFPSRLVSRFSPALAKLHQSDRHTDEPWNGDGTVMFLNVKLSLAGLLKDIWLFATRVSVRVCATCTRVVACFARAGTVYV